MPLQYRKIITRDQLRNEPETLFVFGDNMHQVGKGGQAAEMRGIPTKWSPHMRSDAFFKDSDAEAVCQVWIPIFKRLAEHLDRGGSIVWPKDGIGTGLAELPSRAPELWRTLESNRVALERTTC
jgi:hypothetical protein